MEEKKFKKGDRVKRKGTYRVMLVKDPDPRPMVATGRVTDEETKGKPGYVLCEWKEEHQMMQKIFRESDLERV